MAGPKYEDGPMADVAVIMGSQSDWATMKLACDLLNTFGISNHAFIISAHRTPQRTHDFGLKARSRGYKIIIAGAGGAAHLPGLIAALTSLPVIGVPIQTRALGGVDSLYSIVQMPGGIPVATMAIGDAGAKNAAVFAAKILALGDQTLAGKVMAYAKELADAVAFEPVDIPAKP